MPRKDVRQGPRRVNVRTEHKENRDPNGINPHLVMEFYDVFGERTPQSFDCIWDFSKIFYDCFKGCIYSIFVCFCGWCIALEWGIQFAFIAFQHVWCFSPCLKICDINMSRCGRIWRLCLNCCIKPCTWSCGGIFIAFRTEGVVHDDQFDIVENRMRKSRIVQPPKKNKVQPQKQEEKKEEKKSDDNKQAHLVPAAIIVAPAVQPKPDVYLGEKMNMKGSVQRQMML